MRGLRTIDWFVPDALRARGPETLRRARTAVATCGIAALLVSASALLQATLGHQGAGWTPALMALLFASVPFLLRATGAAALAIHAPPLLLLAFAAILIARSGDQAIGGLFAAVAAPIVAALLGGTGPGIAWGAITCAALAGAALSTATGALPLDPLPAAARSPFRATALFTLGMLAVVTLYELLLRRAQAERRASEARFRALTEEASDVVAEWDTTGFVRYVSPRIEVLTGTSPDGFVDTHWLEHVERIHPEDVESFGRALEHVVEGRTDVAVAMRFRHGDGSWRWFEFGMRRFRTAGGELRVVSVARDVTDRREVEALRAQIRP